MKHLFIVRKLAGARRYLDWMIPPLNDIYRITVSKFKAMEKDEEDILSAQSGNEIEGPEILQAASILKCSVCLDPAYCPEECQRTELVAHELLCKSMKDVQAPPEGQGDEKIVLRRSIIFPGTFTQLI